MEMSEREQRAFIRFLANELKKYTRELMAYQLCFAMLKEWPVEHAAKRLSELEDLDRLLEGARNSPALQKKFDQNFEGFDAILPPPEPAFEDRVRELLARWKPPEGSPN